MRSPKRAHSPKNSLAIELEFYELIVFTGFRHRINDRAPQHTEPTMFKPLTTIKNYPVADIRVLGDHRDLVKEKVQLLADLIKEIGLKTLPTVHPTKKGPVLIAGHHRLAAAKLLGWERIDCVVMRGDKIDRQLWRTAENLYRADLTKLQRAEGVNKWNVLIKKKAARVAQRGGHQPADKGLSKTAKQLGISREKARRSKKIAGISKDAKAALKSAGLDDNQEAMLKVAKASTPEEQVKTVQQIVAGGSTQLTPKEAKQYKVLKSAFVADGKFKKAWDNASTAVHRKFAKKYLKP